MVRGVLFDFDNTLVYSEPSRWLSTNDTLREFNVGMSEEEWKGEYKRLDSRAIFQSMKEKHHLDYNVEEMYKKAHKRRIKIEKEEGVEMIEGARELLHFLLEHEVAVAICTGGTKEHCQMLMDMNGFPPVDVIARGDYEKGKPNPDCYFAGLRKLNLYAEEVLVFDDSYNGLLAGIKANCRVVAVNTQGERDLEKLDIFRKIENYTELDFEELLRL